MSERNQRTLMICSIVIVVALLAWTEGMYHRLCDREEHLAIIAATNHLETLEVK